MPNPSKTNNRKTQIIKQKSLLTKSGDYHEQLIESLQDPEEASAYLKVALEEFHMDGNTRVLLVALRNVAEARGGLTNLAKKTHLNRQSLYKTLSSSGNPTIETFGLILNGLGYHLSIEVNKPNTKSMKNKTKKVA